MKTNKFVEELKNKSANELNDELVAVQFKIPECDQSVRQHIPDQGSTQEYCTDPDCYH